LRSYLTLNKSNNSVQRTSHALSNCVQLAALPLSHTIGQHMQCRWPRR